MSDIFDRFDKLANTRLPKEFEMYTTIELSDIVNSKLFYTADKTPDFILPEKVVIFTFHPDAFLPFFRFKVYQKGIKKHILDHLKKIVWDSYRDVWNSYNREMNLTSNGAIADEINNKVKSFYNYRK